MTVCAIVCGHTSTTLYCHVVLRVSSTLINLALTFSCANRHKVLLDNDGREVRRMRNQTVSEVQKYYRHAVLY